MKNQNSGKHNRIWILINYLNLIATNVTATNFIIGVNTLNTTEWAFLDGLNQSTFTTSSPTFANIYVPDEYEPETQRYNYHRRLDGILNFLRRGIFISFAL